MLIDVQGSTSSFPVQNVIGTIDSYQRLILLNDLCIGCCILKCKYVL